MAISMAGLDLAFMRENPLPKRQRKRVKIVSKRAENVAIPAFIGDIKPFVSIATDKPVEITSRSQLRAYERGNGIRQCGDFKSGEIIGDQNKRWKEATYVSPEDKAAADFKWVD